MTDCCTLARLGLCPECEEQELLNEANAAADAWIDNQIKWEQEQRLGIDV